MPHRLILPWILVLVLVGVARPVSAEVALYLIDGTGDSATGQITPGATFDVTVGLGTADGLVGVSYLLAISANGSGQFSIVNRTLAADNPLSDLTTKNPAVLLPAAALLDPVTDSDLGGLVEDLTAEPAPGVYPLATFTIQSAADVAPGTYTLTFASAVGTSVSQSLLVTLYPYTLVVASPGTGGGSTGSTEGGTSSGGTDTETGSTDSSGTDTGTTGGTDSTTTDGSSTGTDTTQTDGSSNTTTSQEQTASPAGCGVGASSSAAIMAMSYLALVMYRRR